MDNQNILVHGWRVKNLIACGDCTTLYTRRRKSLSCFSSYLDSHLPRVIKLQCLYSFYIVPVFFVFTAVPQSDNTVAKLGRNIVHNLQRLANS